MKKNKATRVKVAKGYGPRHAENAKEGDLTKIPTDTVAAMLTPREAVLNRNAAELAGRDKIEKLNARGNELAERGVDLASGGKTMKEKPKKMQGGDEAVAGKRKPQGSQNTNQYGVAFGWNPPGPTGPPEQVPGYGTVPGPGDAQGTQNVNRWGVPYGWNPSGGGVDARGTGPFPSPMPLPSPAPAPGGMQGGPQPLRRMPGGNFYPPGQGMQYGESAVGGGGGSIYGNAAPVQLSAPGGLAELVAAIKAEAKKQGLSAEQMKGLMGAFSSFGGGGGGFSSDANVAASVPDTSAYGLRGYQGGISEIGYPPFVGPNMQYHGDKGGWQGPYDPMYTIPVYQRGTASVRGSPSFGKPGSIPGKNSTPGFQTGTSDYPWSDPGDINLNYPPSSIGDLPGGEVPLQDYPSRWGVPSGPPSTTATGGDGPLDLENRLGWDPSRPTYGFGSGRPTQRGIGTAAEIVGNAMFPGLGLLTGPIARMITRMIQRGASRDEIKAAVTQAQESGGGGGGGKPRFELPKLPQGLGMFGQPLGPKYGQTTPGQFGVGGPTMRAGGGSYFGGPAGPHAFSLPGATYNLGGMGIGAGMRGAFTGGFRPAGLGLGWNRAFGTQIEPGGGTGAPGGGPHWNPRQV